MPFGDSGDFVLNWAPGRAVTKGSFRGIIFRGLSPLFSTFLLVSHRIPSGLMGTTCRLLVSKVVAGINPFHSA